MCNVAPLTASALSWRQLVSATPASPLQSYSAGRVVPMGAVCALAAAATAQSATLVLRKPQRPRRLALIDISIARSSNDREALRPRWTARLCAPPPAGKIS
ncbi:MAG TPA: hypothetical protein VGH59_02430 [Casimicrobiaceae bacterium]